MYNQSFLKGVKFLIGCVVVVAVFFLGYCTSTVQHSFAKKPTLQMTKQTSSTSTSDDSNNSAFNSKLVEEFLIAYYTRKDLGENQSRYKPFMTEGLFNATVSDEEKPVQQAYKGYVVDQVYQSSTIYLNEKQHTALVQVKFSSLLLEQKDNREGGSVPQDSTLSMKLSYTEANGKYLVNQMENVVLSNASESTSTLYGDLGTTTPSSATTSSSQGQ